MKQPLPEKLPVARQNIAGKLLRALQHSDSGKHQKMWAVAVKNR